MPSPSAPQRPPPPPPLSHAENAEDSNAAACIQSEVGNQQGNNLFLRTVTVQHAGLRGLQRHITPLNGQTSLYPTPFPRMLRVQRYFSVLLQLSWKTTYRAIEGAETQFREISAIPRREHAGDGPAIRTVGPSGLPRERHAARCTPVGRCHRQARHRTRAAVQMSCVGGW
jgi:hypothetical protein